MTALPKGWDVRPIGELGKWSGGGTPSKSNHAFWKKGTIPWVSPKDMKRFFIDDAEDHITSAAVAGSATQLIPKGSVLLVTRSGILRHSLPVAVNTCEVAINQDLKALTPDAHVDPVFIGLQMRSLAQDILASCAKSGTTVDSIDFDRLKAVSARIPPLPEQKRIVAKVDSLSAKSKRAREQLDHIPRLVEKYKQAILGTVFSDTPYKGDLVALSEVIASTFYGPRFAKEAYDSSGVMTLRTTDFDDDGRIKLKSPPAVRVSHVEFAKWGLVDGDILVTRTGSIGKCAQYEDAIGPALPSAYLIRVRLLLDKVRPRYVLLFLLSETGQSQLGLGITAVAQPNINAGVIERLRIPVPSLDVQDKAIRFIERAFTWIDRLASETSSARKLIDHLDQAVLARAFRGALAPQDPNDEPASVLLERIKTKRNSETLSKRTPRRKA